MAKICQCNCNKKDEMCIQCDANLGYSIVKFFSDVRLIEANKCGSESGDNVYTGVLEAEGGGTCDVGFKKEKVDIIGCNYIPSLKMANGLNPSIMHYVNAYEETSGPINPKLKEDIEQFLLGKRFIGIFKTGTAVRPYNSEDLVSYDKICKIKALRFNLLKDEHGDARQVIEVIINGEIDGEKRFPLGEFTERFGVSNKITKKSSKYIDVTDSGIIRPVCIEYTGMKFLIDNTYVYVDDGHKTIPIGCWGAHQLQKNNMLNSLLSNKNFGKLKEAIDCLGSVRKYIAPYWCLPSVVIKGK